MTTGLLQHVYILLLVFSPLPAVSQQRQPPCFDRQIYKGPPTPLPIRVLLGTYPDAVPADTLLRWKILFDCQIEVYEDEQCIRRFVTGFYWNVSNAQIFVAYLHRNRVMAEHFVFAIEHKRIVGWGNWIDFGQRIE